MATHLSLMFARVPRLQPRCRRVAVMFADLDHFTQLCSEAPPRKVYRLVQDFQGVFTHAVSRCKGTVNAFAGDGALATFHDLTGRAGCATRALRCARSVLEGIQALNLGYRAVGHPSVSVSIGLQYGEIAVPRRFGSSIIGDAVNVASRLEQRARALSARIVVGDDLVQRAKEESGPNVSELLPLAYVGNLSLEGRTGKVGTWIFDASTSQAAVGC